MTNCMGLITKHKTAFYGAIDGGDGGPNVACRF